jgi:hypothetical protein
LSRLLAYLWRLAVILAGFAAGALSASLFMNVLMFSAFDLLAENYGVVSRPGFWISVAFFTFFSAYLAFIPVCILVLYSEYLGRRDWLFHALAGGACALYVLAWSWMDPGAHPATANPGFAAAAIAAGMVAGCAYWLVAGRRAGLWLRQANEKGDDAATPSP